LGPTFDKKDYDTDYNLKSVQIEDLVGREQSSFGDFNLIPNYTIEDEVSEMLKMQGESFQTGQKINFQSDVEVMKSNAKSDVSVADSDTSKPGSIKNKFMSSSQGQGPLFQRIQPQLEGPASKIGRRLISNAHRKYPFTILIRTLSSKRLSTSTASSAKSGQWDIRAKRVS
jgi:hypothetical protein